MAYPVHIKRIVPDPVHGFVALKQRGHKPDDPHVTAWVSDAVPGWIIPEIHNDGLHNIQYRFNPDDPDRREHVVKKVQARTDGMGYYTDAGRLLMWKGPPAYKDDTYKMTFPADPDHRAKVRYVAVCELCDQRVELVDGAYRHR